MDTCQLCGLSKLGILVHARLGADEGAVKIGCKCPGPEEIDTIVRGSLDVADSMFIYGTGDTYHLDEGEESITIEPEALRLTPSSTVNMRENLTGEFELTIHPKIARQCFSKLPSDAEIMYAELGCPVTAILGPLSLAGRIRSRLAVNDYYGNFARTVRSIDPSSFLTAETETTVKVPRVSHDYAPMMCYTDSLEAGSRITWAHLKLNQMYLTFFIERAIRVGGWLCRARKYLPECSYSCEFERVGVRPSDKDVLELLNMVHSEFCYVQQVVREIPIDFHKGLRHSARPVKDTRKAPTGEFVYMVKADGEHAWVMLMGSVWYICRNSPELDVMGYRVSTSLADVKPSTVFRAEQMANGRLVFIDFIAVEGSTLPITKPIALSDVLLQKFEMPFALLRRKQHSSLEEAKVELANSLIPADGIVAVGRHTSITYRLKKPTVDLLRMKGGMVVIRRSGEKVKLYDPLPGTSVGIVYECNVAVKGEKIEARNPMARWDKVQPNFLSVFINVRNMLMSTDEEDLVLIDEISNASFMVRSKMYETVINAGFRSKFIIDIGSGRMQSVSILRDMKGYSFLLCDPELDVKNVSNLMPGVDVTGVEGVTAMKAVFEALLSGKSKVAYYKGKVESLLRYSELVHFIIDNRIPVVYSFSLSYVRNVYNCFARDGVKQIGCCYVFDDCVDTSGVLIDFGGVKIHQDPTDGNMMISKFGRKACFREPLTRSRDIQRSVVERFDFSNTDTGEDVLKVVKNIVVAKTF